MEDINCPFWSAINFEEAGNCRLNLYGGTPSKSTCKLCLNGTLNPPRLATKRAKKLEQRRNEYAEEQYKLILSLQEHNNEKRYREEFALLKEEYEGCIDTWQSRNDREDTTFPIESKGQILKGIFGIFKWFFKIKQARIEDSQQRWNICKKCDKNNYGVCQECGCHVSIKIRQKDQQCPVKKW